MAKLIPLAEAASILGMSPEALTELRSNNEVFGYRDGPGWKFKLGELERFAAERGMKLQLTDEVRQMAAESDIDLSAFEISESASDIGFDASGELLDSDSQVLIQDSESGLVLEESAEDLRLDDSGDLLMESQDDGDALSFGESDLSLASGSGKKLAADDTGDDLLDDDESGGGSPSDTGKMAGGDDDDMLLSEDDLFSDEVLMDDAGSFEQAAEGSGSLGELSSDFEDSDMLMEDSDSSTELELSGPAGLKANESGISIDDEPLELGGSDIDSLELPEDDDMIVLDAPGDPDSATLMQEDDFNLTPLELDPEEESSGSQVIALEDSEIYTDESTPTILGESDAYEAGPQMLDDSSDFGAYGAGGLATASGAVPVVAGGVPEAPYSIYQIISLGAVLMLLLVGGAVAYDVARNMWQEDSVISRSVLNFFLQMTGMNNFS